MERNTQKTLFKLNDFSPYFRMHGKKEAKR